MVVVWIRGLATFGNGGNSGVAMGKERKKMEGTTEKMA